MAIPTSIADLTWLLNSEPAGAPFARGAAAGSAIANTGLNRRRLGMQEQEFSEELRIKKAEEARKAQESAIQFAGFQDYQNAVKTGMPPDEAVKKFGASMFYKSPTFPNFLSAQERAGIAADRAHDLARHQTNLLIEKEATRKVAGEQFDRSLLERQHQFDTKTAEQSSQFEKKSEEQTRQFEKKFTEQTEQFDKKIKSVEGEGAKNREAATERELMRIQNRINPATGRVLTRPQFITRHLNTLISNGLAKDEKEAAAKLGKLFDDEKMGLPSPASAPRTTGAFDNEGAARAAGHKAGDIVVLIIEGKPTNVRLK